MSLQKKFNKAKQACKVTFTLPKEAALGAKEVKLLGDFNHWEKDKAIPLKMKDGNYTTTLELKEGEEYQFRYLIDDEIWENDWDADKYLSTPFGVDNSVVVVSEETGVYK